MSVDKMNQFTPSTIIAALLCAFAAGTTAQGQEGKTLIYYNKFWNCDSQYFNCLLLPNGEQAFCSLQTTKNPFGLLYRAGLRFRTPKTAPLDFVHF